MKKKKSCLVPLTLTFLLSFLLLLPLTQLTLAEAEEDLVTTTCKRTPNFHLCFSTLTSDPGSRTADVAGLGVIVVNAVKSKANAALTQLNDLIKSRPELKGPLTSCAELYDSGILTGDVPPAIEGLTKGDPKFAETAMVDSGNEAQSCEEGFPKSTSPLTDVNNQVRDLSAVAAAIARTLL